MAPVMNGAFDRPRIPSHYYVWSDPPDGSGDEFLHFVSERRTIKFKGRAFADFEHRVVPLLDGRHTLEEIGREVSDVFSFSDLKTVFELLGHHNLLENGVIELPNQDAVNRLTPQLNFFHEIGLNSSAAQERLQRGTVTIFGLGGPGAQLAESLANTGVGCIRCVDDIAVASTDLYLTSVFSASDLGYLRSKAIGLRLAPQFPETRFESIEVDMSSDESLASAVKGSDFVVSCLDIGLSSSIYKLNRICLETGIRWISCALRGNEVVIGPTVYPGTTACYLCYRMRAVACAGNPEDAFKFEQILDQRKQDDSCSRENLAMGAGIASNLLAIEIVREMAGMGPATTAGKVVIFNLIDFSSSKHVVLCKPWCPACFPSDEKDADCSGGPSESGRL